MEGKRLIRTIRAKNLLSFGKEGVELELQPLNVLIGPNASGKSNFLEIIGLLRATQSNMDSVIRLGGGIGDWLYKGGKDIPVAEIEAVINFLENAKPLRYRLDFTMSGQQMLLQSEVIENESNNNPEDVQYFYRNLPGKEPVLFARRNTLNIPSGKYIGDEQILNRQTLDFSQSILKQRKDPSLYPEITYLGVFFSLICMYREWSTGPYSRHRFPQKTDLPELILDENGDNFHLVLNNLLSKPELNKMITENSKLFHDGIDYISTTLSGGTVRTFVYEKGKREPIPATRLSDGTLRFLDLLAILCHPNPPPLVCIEEPELGMHPDIIPTIAELLLEASQRMQLIVTTHSDHLVAALSEVPEAVVVCEQDEEGTHMRRLEREELKEWLNEYTLGDLWMMNKFGGTRY